jgi:hypothetical protein
MSKPSFLSLKYTYWALLFTIAGLLASLHDFVGSVDQDSLELSIAYLGNVFWCLNNIATYIVFIKLVKLIKHQFDKQG